MLARNDALLILVDVQGALAQAMYDSETLFANLRILIRGCQVLGVPILWLEQNPAKLGPTIPDLTELLAGQQPIAKMAFSCCGSGLFVEALKSSGRSQVLLAGIEAHVCIYQTAVDLVAQGYHVEVVADAVSSRMAWNRDIGLARCHEAGARLTSVEMALFEMLHTTEDPCFREILRLVR